MIDGPDTEDLSGLSPTSAGVLDIVRRVVGSPAKLHSPLISGHESMYVSECIERGEVTHGPRVEEFESRVKTLTCAKHVIAVSSGTAALHLALLAVGIRGGDKVVVPSFTFVATANAVTYCGAIPQFVDCDEYGGIDPSKLDDWLRTHTVRAVICVHCFGTCCDMRALTEVCERHGVVLIEDAAQALSSYHKGKHAGTFGLAGAFSFNGNKIITTGGGGAVVTRDKDIAKKVRTLAAVAKEDIPGEFWHSEVGFNYRMPNINAALGCGQMENLCNIRWNKLLLSRRYEAEFSESPWAKVIKANRSESRIESSPDKRMSLVSGASDTESNHWLNAISIVNVDRRKETAAVLDEYGYECRLGWTPLHYLPMYKDAERGDLSVTEKLARSIICLPSGPGIIA